MRHSSSADVRTFCCKFTKFYPKLKLLSVNNNISSLNKDLHSEDFLFPPLADFIELSVECEPSHFSASRLAQAIEDCDAHLLNMNVTSSPSTNGTVTILLRAGMRNTDAAINSLERYGYRVTAVHSSDFDPDNSLTERINDLLTRLNV